MKWNQVQVSLVEIANTTRWSTQIKLRSVEDMIVWQYQPVVFPMPCTSNQLRYLALGSIPFFCYPETMQESEARQLSSMMLRILWDTTLLTSVESNLIRRPTLPTGALDASVMIIGDAPGVGDGILPADRFDRVLVYGPSSHMLRKALLSPELHGLYFNTFFTNLLKHATPSNRPSLDDEVIAYRPWLLREIHMIKPRIIITLGVHVHRQFVRHLLNLVHVEAMMQPYVISIQHPSYAIRMGMSYTAYAVHIANVIRAFRQQEKTKGE